MAKKITRKVYRFSKKTPLIIKKASGRMSEEDFKNLQEEDFIGYNKHTKNYYIKDVNNLRYLPNSYCVVNKYDTKINKKKFLEKYLKDNVEYCERVARERTCYIFTDTIDILKSIRGTKSKVEKWYMIEDALRSPRTFQDFYDTLYLVFHPHLLYQFRDLEFATPARRGEAGVTTFEDLKTLLKKLSSKSIKGCEAYDQVRRFASLTNETLWNEWFRYIIVKDLDIYISDIYVINNVISLIDPELRIPGFGWPVIDRIEDDVANLIGKYFVQPIIDGIRVVTKVYPDGRVEHLKKRSKPIKGFQHIQKQLQMVAATFHVPMVLDGVLSNRIYDDENLYGTLWIHDMMTLTEFLNSHCELKLVERMILLEEWIELIEPHAPDIKLNESILLNFSEKGTLKWFLNYTEDMYRSGYQDVILKYWQSEWKPGWSETHWHRYRMFEQLEMTIVDYTIGFSTYKKDFVNYLVCRGFYEGEVIEVHVTKGISMEQRKIISDEILTFLGEKVIVRCDFVYYENGSWKMKFPRIHTFLEMF